MEETIEQMAIHFMKIGWKNVPNDHLEYHNAVVMRLSDIKKKDKERKVSDTYFRLD